MSDGRVTFTHHPAVGWFRMRKTKHAVSVTLWEPVQPISRGERYEDPLFEALEKAGLGGPGDGGGSLCSEAGEIEQVDFDVEVATLDAIPTIVRVLEKAGASRGSELRFERNGKKVTRKFGVTEGLAIYLDGVGLPRAVYKACTPKELLDRVMAALGDDPGGEFRGSWQGPRETSIYLYGADAERMLTAIEPTLLAYPLSRNARIVIRYGNPACHPREIRLSAPRKKTKATRRPKVGK